MDEEWIELLKLREKANLSPKTNYRFESLENYLSAIYTLGLYSEEQKEKLTAQFNELSELDKQEITHRVTNKTHPNFFHLTYDEMEKLQAARKELPFHERARLLSNLILTAAGTAWLDLGEVFEAQIELDDNSSPERRTRPYAYISFSNGHQRHVETVDILASVNKNPAAIGHPAIVFAIHHWQRVIHAKRIIERDDITSRDETWKSMRRIFSGELEVEVAERNLEAIGQKLIRGAKKGAISKEAALAIQVELLGLRLEDTNTLFYKAWERLGSEFIDRTNEVEQVLEKVKADLLAFEKQPHTDIQSRRISMDIVMMFLNEEGERGGKRFIGYNEEGISLKPSWKVFRNAFAAWYFELAQPVVQDYLEKAAKENVVSDDVYQYSWNAPRSIISTVIHYLLTNQLVMAREPVMISETSIGFHGLELEKAIEDAISEGMESEGN
jgi:hypothetical protein